jgi:hypothetical protein
VVSRARVRVLSLLAMCLSLAPTGGCDCGWPSVNLDGGALDGSVLDADAGPVDGSSGDSGPGDAGPDAATADGGVDAGLDAGTTDGGADAGNSDAGEDAGCQLADDCPGICPPCNGPGGCGCGTFKTCVAGTCFNGWSGSCVGDAGSGLDGGCVVATDCAGIPSTVPMCADAGFLSGFSCIDGKCIWECGSSGRTCDATDHGTCLACASLDGGACTAGGAEQSFAGVGEATCPTLPGSSSSFAGTWLKLELGCSGGTDARLADGRLLGHWVWLSWDVRLGQFPALGGTCTGNYLPSAGIVWVWNCPDCQFTISTAF